MTYLKRLCFQAFMVVLGGATAVFVLKAASEHLVIPMALEYMLIGLFIALCLAIGHLVSNRLFPMDVKDAVLPGVRKRSWAWLRPKGDGVKSGFPLNKDHVVIGREVQCAIMLNDNSVSRQHSSITRLAEGYLVKDLGSSNGTYVNGQRIQEYLLQDGDRVSIGDIEFWFEAPASEQASALAVSTQAAPMNQGNPTDHDLGPTALSGGGFNLDPSAGFDLDPDDDDDEEGTESWHPRPEDL